VPGLLLPPGPDADPDHFDIYQNYEVEAERRDALRAHLDEYGVKTLVQWGGKVIHQFRQLGLNHDLPATEAMSQRYLLLPLNSSLSDDDVHYICDAVRSFYVGGVR
jgi:dTDP-4-amino-4,6-dideoxygalactose transaminase